MSAMQVSVVNRQRGRPVDVGAMRRFLERLAAEVPPPLEGTLTLCLVSDRRMRELNRRFRDRDTTTDVLSFADGDDSPAPGEPPHLGDIVIAVPTAERQSAAAGHPLRRELRVLALHGYLHLLGHDHETDGGSMMRLQRRLERRLLPRRGG